METADIVTLAGAIILGYAVLFFTMWLFRRGSKNSEDEKNKKKK